MRVKESKKRIVSSRYPTVEEKQQYKEQAKKTKEEPPLTTASTRAGNSAALHCQPVMRFGCDDNYKRNKLDQALFEDLQLVR